MITRNIQIILTVIKAMIQGSQPFTVDSVFYISVIDEIRNTITWGNAIRVTLLQVNGLQSRQLSPINISASSKGLEKN